MGAHLYMRMIEILHGVKKKLMEEWVQKKDRQQNNIKYLIFTCGLAEREREGKKLMKSRKGLFSELLCTDTNGSCKRN